MKNLFGSLICFFFHQLRYWTKYTWLPYGPSVCTKCGRTWSEENEY